MHRAIVLRVLAIVTSPCGVIVSDRATPPPTTAQVSIRCMDDTHPMRAKPTHTESDHALGCADTRGVWQGPYQERFADESLAAKGRYSNGQPDGTWVFFYRSGREMMRGHFREGMREGVWISYFEDGRKLARGPYVRDALSGRWLSWYEDGTRKSEGSYHNGEEAGTWTYWYTNGHLQSRGAYRGRRIVPPRNASVPAQSGHWTYWYESGAKHMEGCFRDGEKVGKWKEWAEDGSVSATKTLGGDANVNCPGQTRKQCSMR